MHKTKKNKKYRKEYLNEFLSKSSVPLRSNIRLVKRIRVRILNTFYENLSESVLGMFFLKSNFYKSASTYQPTRPPPLI